MPTATQINQGEIMSQTNVSNLQDISKVIWKLKYRHKDSDGTSSENYITDTNKRIVNGVYKNDDDSYSEKALEFLNSQIWCPAGRIQAGAGTNKRVTWINCFVSPTIPDSMDGIFDCLKVAGLTQQMGGGIGMDFSPLRPNGAIVKTVESIASGPLYFMDMWDSMCKSIMSAGSRRGAMMATLACHHPDIINFVKSKIDPLRFRNFNISVLATDDFLDAVRKDLLWDLYFDIPRADNNHVDVVMNGDKHRYIYKRMPARELWDLIIKTTYDYAEPGIVFIDQINKRNNLNYCETISTTNPCGEQPLPPNGDCNLGAINLANLVSDPFVEPEFLFSKMTEVIKTGVRFLDNVIDATPYPTIPQEQEAKSKRRIGLGVTGFANMLQQMKLRYGSEEAVQVSRLVAGHLRDEAYKASVELAKERGPFLDFDVDKFLKAPFIQNLSEDIKQGIAEHGIRNGKVLTIAPTGTTSLLYNNVSSGIEPTFDWVFNRKMLMPDDDYEEFKNVMDYGYLLYKQIFDKGLTNFTGLPDYMVTAHDLTVHEHLVMQAVWQEHIDSSISKTINCPEEMTFEDFKGVYAKAYDMGLKGCTTYRPSKIALQVRGAVLTKGADTPKLAPPVPVRPKVLPGLTYKLKWPGIEQAFYVTINDKENEHGSIRPFEIFINSKSVMHQEWIVALTRMISAVFRKNFSDNGDITFLIEELQQVFSSQGGYMMEKRYVPSIVALIGNTVEEHLLKLGLMKNKEELNDRKPEGSVLATPVGSTCPKCNMPCLQHQEGCDNCFNCGYSNCS